MPRVRPIRGSVARLLQGIRRQMSRTRASAKTAGAGFERTIADYLAKTVDDRIDRRVKTGAKDRGDIAGMRLSPALRGGRVVIECKNERNETTCKCGRKHTRLSLGPWATEAEIERGNDDAVAAVVIHKRHGVGWPGQQWVTMTVDDFVALLIGESGRP
jgi:hypothetical protein